MDLNSLKEQVSNLTLYDIKAGVRKVQNGMADPVRWFLLLAQKLNKVPAVMNYTEMEAKVRTATVI
jgi:epsin